MKDNTILASVDMSATSAWKQYVAEDGNPYYHNAATGVTQWEKPPEMVEVESSGKAVTGSSNLEPFSDEGTRGAGNPFVGPTSGSVSLAGVMNGSIQKPARGLGPADFANDIGRDNEGGQRVALTTNGQTRQLRSGSGIPFIGNLKFCYCFDMNYLQSFFNVNTSDIVERCTLALFPFKSSVSEGGTGLSSFRTNPDFYGPFWITTTVVISIFASFNASVFVDSKVAVDRSILVQSAGIFYGFAIFVPIICGIILYFASMNSNSIQQASTPTENGGLGLSPAEAEIGFANESHGQTSSGVHTLTLRQLVCVYGYSFFPFLPICILCLIHISGDGLVVNVFEWTFVSLGMAVSIYFMYATTHQEVTNIACLKYRYALRGILFGSVIFLFLFYKFYFLVSAPTLPVDSVSAGAEVAGKSEDNS